MGGVRVKSTEDHEMTKEMDGMIGEMADLASTALGVLVRVNRFRDEYAPPGRVPKVQYKYAIAVGPIGKPYTFGKTSNPNEIKRSLSMLVDLLNMGYIQPTPTEEGDGVP